MDWLEHGWIFFFWIEICGGGDTDRPHDRWAKIRKNVAEKIRTHNNIKPVRMPHKMGRQDIDVVLIRADIRIIRSHLVETFIPERHGMDDPIGFCSRGQMLLSGAGQIEGESQDSVYSTSGENCLLNGHFLIRPLVETAANV